MNSKRYLKKLLMLLTLIFILFLVNRSNLQLSTPSPTSSIQKTEPTISRTTEINLEKTYVSRVIDGDTIQIAGGKKVRYIGIDTPETVSPAKKIACFGIEAYRKNKELVEKKTAYLEKDVSETDKFGRLLRYVYIDDQKQKDKKIMVNELLVKEGYASVSTFPPDVKYASLFLEAQTKAREQKSGLWSKCF